MQLFTPRWMFRATALLAIVAGVAFAAPQQPPLPGTSPGNSPPPADSPQPLLEPQRVPPRRSGLNEESAEEILRLRRNRGSVLDGTSLGGDAEENRKLFSELLRKMAMDEPQPLPRPPARRAAPDDRQRLIQSMRETARLLDEQANTLEERREFEQGDQLRSLAADLRHQARTLDGWRPPRPPQARRRGVRR